MQKTDVLITVIDMARAGLGFTPSDAMAQIAELIAEEDVENPLYDSRVERLLRLGACIWSLRRDTLEGRAPSASMPTVASARAFEDLNPAS
ncbi:hypothetical protein [Variovorax boronicumulans]|uniref:hypothetical protein n=1 Tax=Variovorax boronicumulans TaxID=436515 RepID=UPI00339380B8